MDRNNMFRSFFIKITPRDVCYTKECERKPLLQKRKFVRNGTEQVGVLGSIVLFFRNERKGPSINRSCPSRPSL